MWQEHTKPQCLGVAGKNHFCRLLASQNPIMDEVEDALGGEWALGDDNSMQYLRKGDTVAEFDGEGTWTEWKVERVEETSPPDPPSIYVMPLQRGLGSGAPGNEEPFEPAGAWVFKASAAPPETTYYKFPNTGPGRVQTGVVYTTFGSINQETPAWQTVRYEDHDPDSKKVTVWYKKEMTLEEVAEAPFLLQLGEPVAIPAPQPTRRADPQVAAAPSSSSPRLVCSWELVAC
jgi:hypothetical protein